MHKPLKSIVPLLAATAAVSLAAQSMAATLTTGIAVPFTATATPASATPATYTTLNVSSMSTSSTPNGAYVSTIIGTTTGTISGGFSVSTGYAYDAVNGFRLIGLYTTTSTGAHTNTNMRGANGIGQVIGASPVNSSFSADSNGILGTDGWLYSTAGNSNVSLGLTGANFSYTKNVPVNGAITPVAFSGSYHSTTPLFVNDAGQVVGSTSRFGGDSATTPATLLGTSAWLYNGATTSEIGLTGSGYSYTANTGAGTTGRYSSNSLQGQNASGTVIGYANAFYDRGDGTSTALGQDGWIYNAGTTTTAGLYQRGIDPDVQGFNALGYKYYSVPTSNVGATPTSSQNRYTSFNSINASGQVAGISQYYTASVVGGPNPVAGGFKGTDGFVYTPATGTYRQIGLYANTGNFTTGVTPVAGSSSYVSNAGARSTSVNYLNNSGKSVGTSSLYIYYANASGASTPNTSTAAWFDDGVSAGGSTRIGLYGQAGDPNPTAHVNPVTTVASSGVTNLTNSGLVGGYSTRYYLNGATGTASGQDAWVYNSNTGTTYLIDPTDAATNANTTYTSSAIAYLSEDGYAVGNYSLGTGPTSSGSFNKAFLWSLAGGFVDLGTSISPSLSAMGYQNLITAYYSSVGGGTIYSSASLTGSNTTLGALVAITVPEPTSLAALAMVGFSLLRRRRNR